MKLSKIIGRDQRMAETAFVGMLLAFSGGYMDAYTYLFRDKVFANAQTGNMLLLGVHLSEGDFLGAVRYFWPIFSFGAGVFIAQLLKLHFKKQGRVNWWQAAVLTEAMALFLVSFIDTGFNLYANSLVSFACGIQVQAFRKINGNGMATTMCIGNFRSATDALCNYIHTREQSALDKVFLYYGIILTFVCGAVFGNAGIRFLGERAILVSSGILLVVFFIMFIEKRDFPEKETDFS